MGQEFHVVRCFSCESFQVQQVKKVNKWTCKMCGEKQTLKKEFGRGSGADCRRHVQKLNAMRGAMMEEQEARSLWAHTEAEEHRDNQEEEEEEESHTQEEGEVHGSRWSKFLDAPAQKEEEEVEDEEENVLMDRQRLRGNNRTDRKRKRAYGGGDSWTREQPNRSPLSTKPEIPSVNRPTIDLHGITDPHPTSIQRRTHTTTPQNLSLQRTHPTSPQNHPISIRRWPHTTSPQNLSQQRTHSTSPQKRPTSSQQRTHPTSPPNPKTSSVQWEERQRSVTSSSKWSVFLSSDCQAENTEEDPSSCEGSQKVGGAFSAQPRPLLPVSSMFESGDDFSFDDTF